MECLDKVHVQPLETPKLQTKSYAYMYMCFVNIAQDGGLLYSIHVLVSMR